MDIKLDYRCEEKEYVCAYQKYMYWTKICHPKDPAIILGMCLTVIALLYMFQSHWILMLPASIVFTIAALYLYCFYVRPVRAYRKIPQKLREGRMMISDDSIEMKVGGFKARIPWFKLGAVLITEDFYYLIHADRSYTLILKKTLQSEGKEKEFEKLIYGLKCQGALTIYEE